MASGELIIRPARRDDVPALVRLLADDQLGSTREVVSDPPAAAYYAAFDEIAADANNVILVATEGDVVLGALQLTFTPSLSYMGGWRATVESVRTEATRRGQGIGSALMRAAIERARQKGCVLMQLTTHGSRVAAHRFYEKLGFKGEHLGMKLKLRTD
jgi:ribosomal protein S18 acetylase RimI-like enzyme